MLADYLAKHKFAEAFQVALQKVVSMSPRPQAPLAAVADILKDMEAQKQAAEENDITIMARHAEEIRAAAVQCEPDVTALLLELASEFGGTMSGLDFKFKDQGSMMRKLKKELREAMLKTLESTGTTDVDLEALVWDLGDSFRYTMLVPTERYTEAVKASVARFEERGMAPAGLRNYWPGGDAYQGINDNFSVPCAASPASGRIKFELQFHTPESFRVKMEDGHELYEIQRTTNDPVKKMAVFKQQVAVAAAIPVPPGVLDIPHTISLPLKGEVRLYAELVLQRAMASQDMIVEAVQGALGDAAELSTLLASPAEVEAVLARLSTGQDDSDHTTEMQQAVKQLSSALVITACLPHDGYAAQASAAVGAARAAFDPCGGPVAINGWATDNTTRGTAWPNHCLGIWLPLLAPGKDDGVAFTQDNMVPFVLALQTTRSHELALKLQAKQAEMERTTTKYERRMAHAEMKALRSKVSVPDGAAAVAL